MTKLLRKYNKWLLSIGGSLLMVTFLLTGPQSIFTPDPAKQVVATMDGESVRRKDIGEAEKELDAVKAFVPQLIQGMQIESGAHWLLLSKEATEAGLVGAEGDGNAWIKDLAADRRLQIARYSVVQRARQQYPQFADQLLRNQQIMNQMMQQELNDPSMPSAAQIEQIMRSGPSVGGIMSVDSAAGAARISVPQFNLALAKLHGILRMQEQYMNAARTSDRRAVVEVKRTFDRVLVNAVLVPASKVLEGAPEPTEAQIAEQYLKYKEVKPGTGDLGFGYLQPARVKLEWMMLDRDAIAATINIDPVDANKYWRQNKDKYKGEFAADKAQVEADLRNAKVELILQEADRYYKTHLRGYTRTLAQDGAVKKLPGDWDTKRPKMADLAAELDKSLKAVNPAMPAPSVDARTADWVKIASVSSIPGVGTSRFRIGTKMGTLSDLLGELSELNSGSTMGLQARVPFESSLTDGKGNVYYVNVLEYRAESAPESLEEVKPEVVKDIRLMEAFEALKGQQGELQLLAVQDGLDAVAKKFATPAPAGATDQTPTPLQVQKLVNVRRDTAQGSLDAAPVRDTVMSAAEALGPQFKASPENAVQRTMAIAIPNQFSVAVVQIEGQVPVTVEDLRTASKTYFDRAAQEELGKATAGSAPFSFAAMKQRYNYKAVASTEEGKNADSSASSGSSSPARQSDFP